MTTMKDSLVVFLEQARVNFKLFGYLVPVFAVVLDGEPRILGVSWKNPAEKDAFAHTIEQWIAENRLTEFIMVAEAWAASVNLPDAIQHLKQQGSLESWPGRQEVVVVTYCSPHEEIECTADIIRGTMGLPTLGSWSQVERQVRFNQSDFSARFQGLFLKGKAEQN